jgi:hypothetical protein
MLKGGRVGNNNAADEKRRKQSQGHARRDGRFPPWRGLPKSLVMHTLGATAVGDSTGESLQPAPCA